MLIFIEYFVIDLVFEDGKCVGVLAWCLEDGKIHLFQSHIVILATGGYGRAIYVYISTYMHRRWQWNGQRSLHCKIWSSYNFINWDMNRCLITEGQEEKEVISQIQKVRDSCQNMHLMPKT